MDAREFSWCAVKSGIGGYKNERGGALELGFTNMLVFRYKWGAFYEIGHKNGVGRLQEYLLEMYLYTNLYSIYIVAVLA